MKLAGVGVVLSVILALCSASHMTVGLTKYTKNEEAFLSMCKFVLFSAKDGTVVSRMNTCSGTLSGWWAQPFRAPAAGH